MNRNPPTSMLATTPKESAATTAVPPNGELMAAIRRYVRTRVNQHGVGDVRKDLGVSRHTLWRFLEHSQMGRAIPKAVLDIVGQSVETLDAATEQVIATGRNSDPAKPAPAQEPVPQPQGQQDTLLSLCAAPMTTVSELCSFTRVPATTLRDRLQKLGQLRSGGLETTFEKSWHARAFRVAVG